MPAPAVSREGPAGCRSLLSQPLRAAGHLVLSPGWGQAPRRAWEDSAILTPCSCQPWQRGFAGPLCT